MGQSDPSRRNALDRLKWASEASEGPARPRTGRAPAYHVDDGRADSADRDEVAHLTKPAQSFAAGPLDERRDQ
jgi:hypothetical protein